ncbi:unnamed protein product, partial [Phaeothamnion confervicola]
RVRTWSNPSGLDLTPIASEVWAAERPFVWNYIDVGGRSAVVRLSDQSLWVHSPVELDDGLRAALAELGPVRHIVSPNYEHVKYARQWLEAFPEANGFACPGLRSKMPNIPYTDTVGAPTGQPYPEAWPREIEACWFPAEKNPFTGRPFFNEVVFYHRPSQCLFVSDVYWNYPAEVSGEPVPKGTRLWKFGMDQVYLPFYKRLMVSDRSKYEKCVETVLAWDFETLVPCHGLVIRGSDAAHAALREHLLLP